MYGCKLIACQVCCADTSLIFQGSPSALCVCFANTISCNFDQWVIPKRCGQWLLWSRDRILLLIIPGIHRSSATLLNENEIDIKFKNIATKNRRILRHTVHSSFVFILRSVKVNRNLLPNNAIRSSSAAAAFSSHL